MDIKDFIDAFSCMVREVYIMESSQGWHPIDPNVYYTDEQIDAKAIKVREFVERYNIKDKILGNFVLYKENIKDNAYIDLIRVDEFNVDKICHYSVRGVCACIKNVDGVVSYSIHDKIKHSLDIGENETFELISKENGITLFNEVYKKIIGC